MNEFYTVRELGEKWGFDIKTIYGWLSRREIPYYKIGYRVRIPKTEADEWFQRHRIERRRI